MYIPNRGVIILMSDVHASHVPVESPNKIYVEIDCGPRIIRDQIRRENKQREQDARKGIWRYK